MSGARIVIGHNKKGSRMNLKEVLVRAGYQVQAEAGNVGQLLRQCRTLFPDLVIIDAGLEGGSIAECADYLEDDGMSVLVLAGENEGQFVRDHPHLCKPFSEETLLSVVEVCLYYREILKGKQQELERIKSDLEARKIVERAKGILMKELGLNEEEAYRRIQRKSMNRGLPMADLAREIIAVYEKKRNRR